MVLPVSTCGVLIRGLLLAVPTVETVEQPSSAVYSLCAPHNSAWEVEITTYRKLQDRA